ncbi:hypothetical protein [Rivibacter subsaxonicus]|uniref:hypothetical protein n=1 Tax=Rivibacter subsaxonicus TaxID=457575 RepID=UPI00102C0E3E|nr:hypothetical protein [Rivibacter subsaxonicus]
MLASVGDPLLATELEARTESPPQLSFAMELNQALPAASPPVPGVGTTSTDISYRLWADGPGRTGIGLGLDTRSDWHLRPDAPPALAAQRSTMVLAMRYRLSGDSSLVLDVQPLDAAGLARPFDELRPRLGFEFRTRSSGEQMLRQRMLRMDLGSDAYVGLRTSRRGVSLVYRASF